MSKYSKALLELVRDYEDAQIEFPDLKTVTLAMWLLESARGKSKLALEHNNFGGMKYDSIIKDICKRINYKSEYYCEFENNDNFIDGFWKYLEQDVFDGWMSERTSKQFINHIGPLWSSDDKYASKVIGLLDEATALLEKAAAEKWKKFAIVVGHTTKAKGAFAIHPLGRSEFDFNSELADIMKKISKKHKVITEIFFRNPKVGYSSQIKQVYNEVNDWNPDYSIELHFNAAGKTAAGSEVLCSGSSESQKFAKLVQKEMVDLYNRKGKTDRGVKKLKKGDRGYLSIVSGRAPAIIVEPFFGSNEGDCKLMVELGLKKLAEANMKAMGKL